MPSMSNMGARHWVEWLTWSMWEASFSDWSPRRLLLELTDLERTRGREGLLVKAGLFTRSVGTDELKREFFEPSLLGLSWPTRSIWRMAKLSSVRMPESPRFLSPCCSA